MKSTIVGAVLVCAASAAVLGLIVGISPFLSSAEARACFGGADVFVGFETTSPPAAVASVSFFEDGENRRTLADLRGRGIVLNFWATWCAPCVREMPALDRLHAAAGDAFHVLALSSDRGGAPVVDKFYAETGIVNLANLIDDKGQVLRKMKVRGLPTTVLIDGSGKEIGRVLGAVEWDTPRIVNFLRACLAPAGKPVQTAVSAGPS